MIKKPCVETGCPNYALGGKREPRCRDCRYRYTAERNQRKPAAYRDPRYLALRRSPVLFPRGNRTACWICGLPGATTIDHVVPIARGGTNDLANLRPAHHTCNSGRRDHDVSDAALDGRVTHIGDHKKR